MPDYISNLIINFLLMAIAIISVFYGVYNKSVRNNLLLKIIKSIWVLISLAILSIGFNFYKDWRADSKQKESEKEIKQLQESTKDSIIKAVNIANINSIKATNEALAKYNLKFIDSLNSVVSTIKLKASNPQLSLAPCEKGKQIAFLNNEKNKLNIQFVSKEGTSCNVLIYCYYLLVNGSRPEIINSSRVTFGESSITQDVITTLEADVSPDMLIQTKVVVFLTGSFSKDYEGNIKIPFNAGFEFDFKENKYLSGIDWEFKKLKRILKIE